MNTLSSLLKFIGNKFALKTHTPTITLDSGAKARITSATFYQRSGVMSAYLVFETTGNITAGDNVMSGTISGVPLPASAAMLVGFFGKAPVLCVLYSGGSFTIRNASENAIGIGGTMAITGCYVANSL